MVLFVGLCLVCIGSKGGGAVVVVVPVTATRKKSELT